MSPTSLTGRNPLSVILIPESFKKFVAGTTPVKESR